MKVIRASEIGEYVFCHRAWWLHHVQGFASTNVKVMETGTNIHATHGRRVWAASTLRLLAILLVVVAALILIATASGFDLWHLSF